MNRNHTTASAVFCACAVAAACPADIIDIINVGDGLFTSTVQIDFADGDGYLFNVGWTSVDTTGWDLMLTIADNVDSFELQYSTSEWGVFLEGITYGANSDLGVGAGWPDVEDYWHYWTRESAESEWAFSWTGADARQVADGSWDGWVFLSPDAPQATGIPAPGGLALLALSLCSTRRRRRRFD